LVVVVVVNQCVLSTGHELSKHQFM